MSEILLLHTSERSRAFGGMPPLGLAWIASFLDSRGCPTDLVDMQISQKPIDQILHSSKPRIVGLSGTTHTRFTLFEIAKQIKEYDSAITVLFGGPHATFTAEDTLSHIPSIDIVARGEGEYTTLALAERLLRGNRQYRDVAGISFRQNGDIVHTPDAPRIQDLDALPLPKRPRETLHRYDLKMDFLGVPGTSIMTSRGCPVNCSFCSASAFFGKSVSYRSARSVVDEVEMLVKDFGFEGIKIFDSTFTLKRAHVESICAELVRRQLRIPWDCEVRVNTVTKDLLRAMRDAGCYAICFGVESGSDTVLRNMHKNITIVQAESVLRWARELGLRTKVFFTIGHIGETMEEAELTFRFMEEHRFMIDMFASSVGIRVYPGTEVERHARSTGCLPESFSWSLPFEEPQCRALGIDPLVPVLVQPQLGWDQLKELERRHLFFWLKDPIASFNILRAQWRTHRGRPWWGILKGLFTRRSGSNGR